MTKGNNLSKDDELLLFVAKAGGESAPILDLHGKRAFEVESLLDQFLNSWFLAGAPFVKIVHGFGTGAMQNAVNSVLKDHPLVKLFKPSHGGGAILAVLEEKE